MRFRLFGSYYCFWFYSDTVIFANILGNIMGIQNFYNYNPCSCYCPNSCSHYWDENFEY
jgi:hypothetical protein